MRANATVGINQIERRRKAQSGLTENANTLKYRDIALNSLSNNSPTTRNDISRFISEAATTKNMNYCEVFDLLDKINGTRYMWEATNLVASEIVPSVNNLKDFNMLFSRYNYGDQYNAIIENAIKTNHMCDNIINRHNTICERFNIDGFVKENSYIPINILMVEMCAMIDTFNTDSPKKLDTALEEISYLLQKNGIKYDQKDLTKNVLEYFIHRKTEDSQQVFDSYKKVLKNSTVLTKQDLESVSYFLETPEDTATVDIVYNPIEYPADTSTLMKRKATIVDMVNAFKASPFKREEDFYALINNINKFSKSEVISALPMLMEWMKVYLLNELYEKADVVVNAWRMIIGKLLDDEIDDKDVSTLRGYIDVAIEELSRYDQTPETDRIYRALKNTIVSINDYRDVHFTSDTIKKNLGISNNSEESYKLESFMNSDAYRSLAELNRSVKDIFINECTNSNVLTIKENTNVLLLTEKDFYDIRKTNASIIDCITEDGIFDHVITILDVKEPGDLINTREAVNNFCSTINNEYNMDKAHLYYSVMESIIEIHLESNAIIDLSNSQRLERENCFTESELTYFGMLENFNSSMETFTNIDSYRLAETFAMIEPNISADELCNVLEIAQFAGGLISYSRIKEMANTYRENNPNDYLGNSKIQHIVESWKLEPAEYNVMAEAVDALNEAVLNEIDFNVMKNKKKEDNSNGQDKGIKRGASPDQSKNVDKTDKENSKEDRSDDKSKNDDVKDNKKVKDKLNLNTLKMATMALKHKAKDLDAKAKKMSDDIDIAANQFMKAVKDLYSNDNRESIIRGSIIPSFHKLFQRAIVGAAGSGVIALFNPTMGIVSAALYVFSLIAVSKHNTAKERALLIDEINIEIDVTEKEMSIAESNGKMKKYRQLAAYKKKLQRERQRMKYNISYRGMVPADNTEKE